MIQAGNHSPREARGRRRTWLPWLVGLLGLGLSVAGFWMLRNLEKRNHQLLAEDEAGARGAAVVAAVGTATSVLRSAKAVFDSSQEVTRAEFATLSRLLVPNLPGPAALLWLPRVPHAERPSFERAAHASGLTGFVIYDSVRSRAPSPRRDEYYPVLFMEPSTGLLPGFDPGSSPRRLRALRTAADGATLAADRLQDPALPSGMAIDIVAPVYVSSDAPHSLDARRDALRGFVGIHIDIAAFLSESLTSVPSRAVTDTWLVDENGSVLFSRVESNARLPPEPTAADLRRGVYFERVIEVGDRRWALVFHPHLPRGSWLESSVIVLVLGVMLTAIIVLYTRRLHTSEDRLEALVYERTRDLRSTLEQLQQAQKMEAVGRLTGGIAHDFNNLLTIVMGNVALARDAIREEEVKTDLLDPAMAAALRGADLTQRLLAFSRRQTLQPRVVRVARLVTDMKEMLHRTLAGIVELEIEAPVDLWPILADPAQLEAALLNLCINARDAMPTGGRITISMENTQLSANPTRTAPDVVAGDYVMLSVSDTGAGMSEEVRARAFEPFFTTKEIGKGSGLGLSMVFGFVKQSSGHITLWSDPGKGTIVRLYFPRAKE